MTVSISFIGLLTIFYSTILLMDNLCRVSYIDNNFLRH